MSGDRVCLESTPTIHSLLFSPVAGVTLGCNPSSAALAFVPLQVELWVPTCYFLKMQPGQAAYPKAEPVDSLQSESFLLPED